MGSILKVCKSMKNIITILCLILINISKLRSKVLLLKVHNITEVAMQNPITDDDDAYKGDKHLGTGHNANNDRKRKGEDFALIENGARCPKNRPSTNFDYDSPCDRPLSCGYDQLCCCGECYNTFVLTCDQGKWFSGSFTDICEISGCKEVPKK